MIECSALKLPSPASVSKYASELAEDMMMLKDKIDRAIESSMFSDF